MFKGSQFFILGRVALKLCLLSELVWLACGFLHGVGDHGNAGNRCGHGSHTNKSLSVGLSPFQSSLCMWGVWGEGAVLTSDRSSSRVPSRVIPFHFLWDLIPFASRMCYNACYLEQLIVWFLENTGWISQIHHFCNCPSTNETPLLPTQYNVSRCFSLQLVTLKCYHQRHTSNKNKCAFIYLILLLY